METAALQTQKKKVTSGGNERKNSGTVGND